MKITLKELRSFIRSSLREILKESNIPVSWDLGQYSPEEQEKIRLGHQKDQQVKPTEKDLQSVSSIVKQVLDREIDPKNALALFKGGGYHVQEIDWNKVEQDVKGLVGASGLNQKQLPYIPKVIDFLKKSKN